MRKIIYILLTAGFLFSCATRGGKSEVFSDDFNKKDRFEELWSYNTENPSGTVAFCEAGGIDDGSCVMITNTEKTSQYIRHTLTGLEQGVLYRINAKVRCEEVQDGRGAVVFLEPDGLEQSWNASRFLYGTEDWTDVYMDFVADTTGKATICCGLGFPWGTYNGGKATGKVWYDHVKVIRAPADSVYSREGEHIVLKLDKDKVTITDEQVDQWLAVLDKTYGYYEELVGRVPYGGRKITILTTPGIEPGYWALAGNPILWNNNVAVSNLLERMVEFDDWGFGILHEIGHVFNTGNRQWNWNDEIFANFRMSYAIEMGGGTVSQRDVCYKGADIINYYKMFYDETIGAGVPKNNGDALHYTFLRIKDRYGWDVYKKALRELNSMPEERTKELGSAYDKFLFFLARVSEAAGEDVVAATYTDEELKLIEQSLKS